jgi:phosphate starvation-inducible PhoH-like protein
MKLLLTRIGTDSKFFISGDLEQTDRYKDKKHSGLWDALERLKNMSEVGVHQFGDEDVVRNPIITELLKRYEDRD